MAESADVLKEQVDRTRARLDRDLNRLNTQIASGKERVIAASQWWLAVSAIAAGVIGAIVFWPREPHRRRVRLVDVAV